MRHLGKLQSDVIEAFWKNVDKYPKVLWEIICREPFDHCFVVGCRKTRREFRYEVGPNMLSCRIGPKFAQVEWCGGSHPGDTKRKVGRPRWIWEGRLGLVYGEELFVEKQNFNDETPNSFTWRDFWFLPFRWTQLKGKIEAKPTDESGHSNRGRVWITTTNCLIWSVMCGRQDSFRTVSDMQASDKALKTLKEHLMK